MKRRKFLKLFAGGTAFAFVAANTPLALIKPTRFSDLNIRMLEDYSVEYDMHIIRFDWADGKSQYGVDVCPGNNVKNWQENQEFIDRHIEPALSSLFDCIRREKGSVYKGIKLPMPAHVKGEQNFEVPELCQL